MVRVVDSIAEALTPQGFRPHWRPGMSDLGVAAFWRRCTWNTNRAVAVLRRPEGHFDIGPYCQRTKWRLLGHTKFIPFLYEVGLQLVVLGEGMEQVFGDPAGLRKAVDKVSNQIIVLQSVFVVDQATNRYACARTWGQLVTGQFQDAIAKGIEAAGVSAADPA